MLSYIVQADERLRLFSQRGRGRGRGRWGLGGRGPPENFPSQGGRGGKGEASKEGLSEGLRERLGTRGDPNNFEHPNRTGGGNHDWRGDRRDRRPGNRFDRYEPTPAEPAEEVGLRAFPEAPILRPTPL